MIKPVTRSRGTRKVRMTITYLRCLLRYLAMAESKKTASKRHAEAYSSIIFQGSVVKVDNLIDRRIESPAAPLHSYIMICLHSTVLCPHVILANSLAIDLYCSLYYEMLTLVNAAYAAVVFYILLLSICHLI